MSRRVALGRWLSIALLALFVTAAVGASGAFAQAPPGPRTADVATPANAPGMSAVVAWNGANVASAPAVSSAISTDFSSTIDVHYTWSSASTEYTISDARLQIFYFGFALGTRDIIDSDPVASTNGTFDMPWDPGVLQWILAGSYALTASLVTPNGTTEWSEQFFVHVTAPAAIGAVLPIILLLIGIYEAYALARSGRQAAISTSSKSGKPSSPSTPASSSSASASGAADAKGESPDDSSPSQGGST
jgi:hypothetical protein